MHVISRKNILKILVSIYHSLHIMNMYMEIDRGKKKKRKRMLWYMKFSVRYLRFFLWLFSIYPKPLYILSSLLIINSILSKNMIFVLRLEILNYYVIYLLYILLYITTGNAFGNLSWYFFSNYLFCSSA